MSKTKIDLKIDPFNIDQALLEQPQLYYEYSKQAAEAKNEKEDAKDNLDIVKIEIESKIRKRPKKYKTEGAIKNAVENHRDVLKAKKRFNKARKNASLLEKAEKAFKQRKSMLQTFVYYKIHNLNSNVKIPNQIQQEINDETSKDIKRQLRSSIKIRRR